MAMPRFNVPAGLAAALIAVSAAAGAAAGPAPAHAPDWGPVQVVIYKEERRLAVYRRAAFEKEFPVVLGLHPLGHKRHEGDARTPEGLYHVVSSREHDRWQFFLALDYPNEHDRELYAGAVARGEIPDDGEKPFGIGHSIGIHGNDREKEQAEGRDWTQGCIALDAADAAEVAAMVPVGTPVWIVE